MKSMLLLTTAIFMSLFLSNAAFAADTKIWTSDTTYGDGDYVKVYIELPDANYSSCNQYLIDPSGNEIKKGSGGCVAGSNLDYRTGQYSYTQSGMLWEFLSSSSEYLGQNFGNWTVKIVVNKNGQAWKTLTTGFEYKYFNAVVGYCTLDGVKEKNCTFLGQPFDVKWTGGGCTSPVELNISYFGGNYNLSIAQGDSEFMQMGLIVVRNMGSPCTKDILNLRFDKIIAPEQTEIEASAKDGEVKTGTGEQQESYPLPTEGRAEFVDARVSEGSALKKITVDVDNSKNVLIVNSSGASAETSMTVGIDVSQLYVVSNGQRANVNVLPDTVLANAKEEFDSVQGMEIVNGSAIYVVKGLKNGNYMELRFDGTTGQAITPQTPSFGFSLTDAEIIVAIAGVIVLVIVLVFLKRRKRQF